MASATDTDQDGTVTGINVTPLVDIMLVLLIVFMVTAHFVQDSGLKINLPKAATTEASPTASLTVSMDNKGALRLLDSEVDLNGLKANLEREAKLNPGVRVTVAADQDLPYRTIVGLLDAIKQAGVTRVALAAEK
ncbi:MAG: Biopolymer transport protein ExbD [Elusimicrobia bacterium]|nr:Biopolymer transport protein ExbD [Elusimicrobiota bacterium]